jgi:ribosomal protein S12 methylthiotransferase accessory factor
MKPLRLFGAELAAPKLHQFGTHRARSPVDTLRAYAPLAPQMGITRLANITGLDSIGLPVYTAIRPNGRTLATSQGKGIDAASAKVSALMEAVELFHEEEAGEQLRWDSYSQLKRRGHVIDVSRLPLRADRKLQLDGTRGLWMEGYDLVQSRPIWIPFEAVSSDIGSKATLEASPLIRSTVGLASGNHLLEAVAHALYEAIEHDCDVLHQTNPDPIRVDLSTVDDPGCRHVLDLLAAASVEVAVWDMTSELEVPAYDCVILDPPDRNGWRVLGAFGGSGCHVAPEIALLRAITEAVQSRLTFIAGSRDDMYRHEYAQVSNEELHRHFWGRVRSPGPRVSLSARTSLATNSFEGDLAAVIERLRSRGMSEIAVVNLTRREFEIPVVKVFVPGLQAADESLYGDQETRYRMMRS